MHSELGRGATVLALAVSALMGLAGTALAQRPVARTSARVVPQGPSSQLSATTPRAGSRDSAQAVDTSRSTETVATVRIEVADLPAPGPDPLSQLAGRVPGARIVGTSGRPGALPSAILNGVRSQVHGSPSAEPLYLVDGVLVYGGMPAIDARDIERLEVTPRGAAAARYGSRAANGIVRVTTRSGLESARALRVRFRSEAGVTDVERGFPLSRQHALLTDATGGRFCVADGAEPLCARTIDWTSETARVNAFPGDTVATPTPLTLDPGLPLAGGALQQNYVSRHWPGPVYDQARQVTRSAPLLRSGVDVSGSLGGTGYYTSFSRLRERGAFRSLDGVERYTGHVNLDQSVGSSLSASARLFYGHDRADGLQQEDAGSLFTSLTRQPASADLLARDASGRLYARTNLLNAGAYYGNPLLQTPGNGLTDELTTERVLAGASVRWSPLDWLDVEGSYGYDRRADRWVFGSPATFRAQSAAYSIPSGWDRILAWRQHTHSAALDLTARRIVGRDLATTWSLRVVSERHEATATIDETSILPYPQPPWYTLPTQTAKAWTSQKLTGLFASAGFVWKGRYVADLQIRRDRYALGDQRPRATLARASVAWRASEERWWPLAGPVGGLALRASVSRAGGAPGYPLSAEDLFAGVTWAPDLRGETVSEAAIGADVELFHRVGVDVTYSRSTTRDLILPVAVAAGPTFTTTVLGNVGSLRTTAWELSVHVPLVRSRDFDWSWRIGYDRSRAVFGALDVPPIAYGGTGLQTDPGYLIARQGERYGTLYGYYVLRGARDCARLPAPFGTDCGTPHSSFQVNSDGWLVWVGKDPAGNAYRPADGLTKNLWTTRLPAAAAPWGVELGWGMLIPLRDSTGSRQRVPLGNVLPDWRLSLSQDLRWRRLRAFALLEAVIGRDLWNLPYHESYLYLTNPAVDQRGADPALAKPVGYFYRAAAPESGAGTGGLYQTLSPYNGTVEDASFAKLREVSVTYRVGRLGGVGDWDVSVIGRNVFTLTGFHGFDPETGFAGGPRATATLNAAAAYTYPNVRTISLALSTTF